MPAVIEVEGLRKDYRRLRGETVTAIDGLDLSVPEGGVYGFLGPNGSGKTTTIRCLLGLVRPTAGRCSLFGEAIPQALPHVISRIGAIVESPALFPTMSGRRNLELLAAYDGIGKATVADAIERVGLGGRGDDLVKTYSLGMRQRLGLAAALTKDPALLVLDEPANGLDPAGIREIRELLRSLGAEGRTVFVSSHILAEIQQTCDRVAILTRGRCVASGDVDEVIATGGEVGHLLVRAGDPTEAASALHAAGLPGTAQPDGTVRVDVDPDRAAEVTRALAASDRWVTELRAERANLEDVFLRLTGDEVASIPAAPRPPASPPPPSTPEGAM